MQTKSSQKVKRSDGQKTEFKILCTKDVFPFRSIFLIISISVQ